MTAHELKVAPSEVATENAKLRELAGFFASVIKSGEPWTSTCQRMYDEAFLPASTNGPVFFYERDFYPLSNFSSFQLEWNGQLWPTLEHAYHAEKFVSRFIKLQILITTSAHDAFTLAKSLRDQYRPDWDEVKIEVMKKLMRAKVEQHPYVAKKLLETGEREIIEDSWRDDYWGWGPHRDGQNHAGKCWMAVRAELKLATDT